MSFILSKELEAELAKPLPKVDKGVVRVMSEVRPDHYGDDMLFLRVVMKDDPMLALPTLALGKRVNRIAEALRERAEKLGIPLFASVRIVGESELPRAKRKRA